MGWADQFRRLSIHAPRAGRDSVSAAHTAAARYFNPRAPCGARLEQVGGSVLVLVISIHAPRAGRDLHSPYDGFQDGISIHAPRAGRDSTSTPSGTSASYFNPRAPCGARRRRSWPCTRCWNFNPRAPCGARRHPPFLRQPDHYFNPRAPCGARQQKYTKLLYTLLRQKAILRQFHAKRRLLKRFSTYKYRNTFLICSANRMGKICTLPLRTTRSLDLPEGMSACSQSARFCFRTFFPSSKTADYPALDP